MSNEAPVWMTDRLHEAAYLKMAGFTHIRYEMDGKNCCWVYADSDELQEEVATYRDREAEVEPREFSRITNEVKREMFEFIDSFKSRTA